MPRKKTKGDTKIQMSHQLAALSTKNEDKYVSQVEIFNILSEHKKYHGNLGRQAYQGNM